MAVTFKVNYNLRLFLFRSSILLLIHILLSCFLVFWLSFFLSLTLHFHLPLPFFSRPTSSSSSSTSIFCFSFWKRPASITSFIESYFVKLKSLYSFQTNSQVSRSYKCLIQKRREIIKHLFVEESIKFNKSNFRAANLSHDQL